MTKYYHVSPSGTLPSLLKPRLPQGEPGVVSYPEPKIPRVSFSDSIARCISAIFPTIGDVLDHPVDKSTELFVYELVGYEKSALIPWQVLSEKRYVHDAHITHEAWVTKECRIKKLGSVFIYNTSQVPDIDYRPFDDLSLEPRHYGPDFNRFTLHYTFMR